MSILEGRATLTNLPLGVWAEEDNCRRNWEASSSAASARSRNATGIPEKEYRKPWNTLNQSMRAIKQSKIIGTKIEKNE